MVLRAPHDNGYEDLFYFPIIFTTCGWGDLLNWEWVVVIIVVEFVAMPLALID